MIDDTLIEKRKKKSWSHVGLIDIIRRLIRAGFFVSRGRTLFGDKVDNEDKVSTITRGALTSGDRKDRKTKMNTK